MQNLKLDEAVSAFQEPPHRNEVNFELLQPVHSRKEKIFDFIFKVLVLVGVFACIAAAIHYPIFVSRPPALIQGRWWEFFVCGFVGYSLITALYLIFRTCLWLFYKPYPPCSRDFPEISLIIPAYNEGKLIESVVHSAINAGYPLRRMEILCVDDGSQDDTFLHMQKMQAQYPAVVKLIQLPRNMGKKAALYRGFLQAKGEILVTVDSDSFIEKGALHHLVSPLVRENNIGAVAGNVKVLNKNQGLIPKMLGVSFVFSFDFTRAYQSTYGAVFCCPGAFSAYRASVVKDVLEEWRNQKFLGVAYAYGEDRSLTNFILRRGFYTVYQSAARVFTMVPTTYSRLSKMYLRWERSNIRETFILGKFILKRYRKKDRVLPFLEYVMRVSRYPVQYFALYSLVAVLFVDATRVFQYFAVVGLLGIIFSLYYYRLEKNSDFIYGIFYSYFSFVSLPWIFPYALVTLRATSWLTR